MDLSHEIGQALRQVRMARGLTLRAAARRSEGRFKPSSIAGYERAERAVTVQRFCDLAGVYGVDPARLLGGILIEAEGEPRVELDLSTLEEMDLPEAETVRSFADRIRAVRGGPDGGVVTLRHADLEVIARATGHDRHELLDLLAAARHIS